MSPTTFSKIPYNEAQFKATHNSYLSPVSLADQLQWNTRRPADNGCRSLELDIAQSDDLNHFSVSHSRKYQTDEPPLSEYLNILKKWAKPIDHDVVTVTIDIKKVKDSGSFPEKLDTYILKHFDEDNIWTPRCLLVDGSGYQYI